MRRFFLENGSFEEGRAFITGDEARHMLKVLRLGPGHEVELFDACGGLFVARIETVGRDFVNLVLLQK
ncbi:MAG: hypothetical protein QMD09_07515, partial [Desulfatibacillaceae bacterium]|nr:hypothetical protein [Desulfatibacillaceae bacterium]